MTHIALLRAVNVAGHQAVTMADIRVMFERAGFKNVQTLLASGNVVFDGGRKSSADLEAALAAAAKGQLKLPIEFFVRSAGEWRAIVEGNPFPKAAKDDPARMVLMCLDAAPSAGSAEALQAAIVGREQVRVDGRHAYFIYPDGQGRSKLTNTVIERHLKARGTARNWNTVLKLLKACS
jgi:uncharacterized protein (DUF1697 family)